MADSYQMMSDEDYPNEIDLSNNNIKKHEIKPFIKTLRKKITLLNLKNNKIESIGAKDLTFQF